MAKQAVGICGSLRRDSFNKRLMDRASAHAQSLGLEYTYMEIGALPLYNQDYDSSGFAPAAEALRQAVSNADLVLMAVPEHNYSIPAALKNALDYLTRGPKNLAGGKTAVIFGGSTGPMGSLRAQLQLRQTLLSLNMKILPQPQVFVPFIDQAFAPNGALADEKLDNMLKTLIARSMDL